MPTGATYNPWAGQGTVLDYAADQSSDPNQGRFGNWWRRNSDNVAEAATLLPGVFCTLFPKKCQGELRADRIGVGETPRDGAGASNFLVIGLAAVIVLLLLAIILKRK